MVLGELTTLPQTPYLVGRGSSPLSRTLPTLGLRSRISALQLGLRSAPQDKFLATPLSDSAADIGG